MTVTVELLTPSHDDELKRFLDGLGAVSPSVLGYHYPFYRDVIVAAGAGQSKYFGARIHGELAGFLPAFRSESAAGIVYSSLPFFGPNAGVLTAPDENSGEIHAALLQTLLTHARDAGALSCSVYTPFLFEEFEHYDKVLADAAVIEKFTQYLDLDSATWSSDVAYDLRKAKRLNVEISKDVSAERVEAFYALYRMNCLEYGIPLKPRRCVDILLGADVLGSHSDIYFAFSNGEMIGGLLMIWSPLTASYYIPCTLPSARTAQPGTVLIDRAVQDARQRGIRYWNWESSPSRASGVFQFKKKWGSRDGSYRIYAQTFQPDETFRHLGKDGIQREFPYYFVYAFDRL